MPTDGTEANTGIRLKDVGITTKVQDYSLYPSYQYSIGFTQRGCRLRCSFCKVPVSEPGGATSEKAISELWRGEPYPKKLVILDNDFFGAPDWRAKIDEIRTGGFKVAFSQGINIRMITEESAEAIGSVHYMDNAFGTRRIYTSWDNKKDEKRLFRRSGSVGSPRC